MEVNQKNVSRLKHILTSGGKMLGRESKSISSEKHFRFMRILNFCAKNVCNKHSPNYTLVCYWKCFKTSSKIDSHSPFEIMKWEFDQMNDFDS
jgi:hypothetical protein